VEGVYTQQEREQPHQRITPGWRGAGRPLPIRSRASRRAGCRSRRRSRSLGRKGRQSRRGAMECTPTAPPCVPRSRTRGRSLGERPPLLSRQSARGRERLSWWVRLSRSSECFCLRAVQGFRGASVGNQSTLRGHGTRSRFGLWPLVLGSLFCRHFLGLFSICSKSSKTFLPSATAFVCCMLAACGCNFRAKRL
jgi:hypothetical protein